MFTFFSFLKNNNVGHSVHLCELFAVKWSHQLPGSGLDGDEVLCQSDGGITTNVTVKEKQLWI